jgi:hypothetical protein
MNDEFYRLGDELRKERDEIAELFRNAKDLSAEKVEEVRKREAALGEKQSRWDVLFSADRAERENAEKLARLGEVRRPVPPEGPGESKDAKPKVRPFASILGESKGYQEIASGGVFKPGDRKTVELGNLTPLESALMFPQIAKVFEPQVKTLFELSSAPQEDERLTRIAFDEQEERSLINLPRPMTASGRTLSYLEETTFTNNAVEKAEGVAAGEAALAFTERTITIEWLPVFIPVTEIAMSDIPWLESYLRGRLGFMVQQRLASQLLNGDGVTPNIKGYATFVTQTQAKGTDPVFDAIYKGLQKCRVNGFADPDAIVVHPNDWQDIRLTRTADGIYLLGNPADKGAETLFGLPVFQTTHQTENTALVGAFKAHSGFVLRDGVSLAASNSHSSFFTEGKVAIRASMRCALVVERILAFTEVTGI